MSEIELQLKLPIDNSLTNLLLYEGIIYLLTHASSQLKENNLTINEEELRTTISNLDNEKIEKIRLQLAGNDIMPRRGNPSVVQKFLQKLNIQYKIDDRITNYGKLLRIINSHSSNLKITTGSISLSMLINKKDKAVYIGNVRDKKDGVSLQLFKTERYSGITSPEYISPEEKLTTYLSTEATLITLLGIYSSFVTRISENRNTYYFFLFFSSDEIGDIISLNKSADEMLLIKNTVRDVLEEIINRSFSEELLITEILVNVKIQEQLSRYRVIENVSLFLVKIAQEDKTYKIYETIPFTIYKRKNTELFKLLNSLLRPNGIILERLRRRDNVEYNNLLSAVNGIYRYVVLNDIQGILTMIREIHNAYNKIKNDQKAKKVAKRYVDLIREISYVTKLL